jgi:hypothetical protein
MIRDGDGLWLRLDEAKSTRMWILTGPAVFGSALWLLGSLGRNPLAHHACFVPIVAAVTSPDLWL